MISEPSVEAAADAANSSAEAAGAEAADATAANTESAGAAASTASAGSASAGSASAVPWLTWLSGAAGVLQLGLPYWRACEGPPLA